MITSHINTNVIRYANLTIFVEKIVFSGKVIKYNRFGMKQDRTILLTNLFLSNIKKKGKVNWLSLFISLLIWLMFRNSYRVLEEDPSEQN